MPRRPPRRRREIKQVEADGFAAETNVTLATKLKHVLDAGMFCVFCIGEPKAIREWGLEAVPAEMPVQLEQIYSFILDPAKVAIVQEPVWTIGTGLSATPEDAHATRGVLGLPGPVDDVADAFAVHGVCGLWAIIALGLAVQEPLLAASAPW